MSSFATCRPSTIIITYINFRTDSHKAHHKLTRFFLQDLHIISAGSANNKCKLSHLTHAFIVDFIWLWIIIIKMEYNGGYRSTASLIPTYFTILYAIYIYYNSTLCKFSEQEQWLFCPIIAVFTFLFIRTLKYKIIGTAVGLLVIQ